MSQKIKEIDFQFLPEKPLIGNQNNILSFGHKEIVEVLKKMVRKSPESFTIGLYGDWGSGKSTIAFSLKEELKKENIPLVIFDVWKHEGDALRRTFLELLVNDLNKDYSKEIFKKNYRIDERNNNNKTINTEEQSLKWKKGIRHIFVIFVFSSAMIIPFLIYKVFARWLNWIDISQDIGQIIITISSLISFSLFFKYINQFIEVQKITTSIDKFKDPQEFEKEFKRILSEGLLKKKIVIVFDNLDRVSGEKALEIMSTIKTFLDPIDKTIENRDVVFIIPCDEKAIKRHLKKALNYNAENGFDYERYSSEYLRKFFNTIIWIPEFYTNELEKLALNNLIATKITNLNNFEVAALIVLVFDKNPRQVIQYINILVSNYLLIVERKIDGFNIQNNIPQFAKYLLLIQKFPDIMDSLCENMMYDLNDFDETKIKTLGSFPQFVNFLELTNHIKIDSLDVFFKLRKSEFDNEFDNSEKLLHLIQTQEIRKIIEHIKSIKDGTLSLHKIDPSDLKYFTEINLKSKEEAFNHIIKQKITKTINPVLANKFIDGLLFLLQYHKIQLTKNTYQAIYNKILKSREYLYLINPHNIISEVIQKIDDSKLNRNFLFTLKAQWLDDFKEHYTTTEESRKFSKNYLDSILNMYAENISLFTFNDLNYIRLVISKDYSNDLELIKKIASNSELHKKLGSTELLNEIIYNANFFNAKLVNDELESENDLLKIMDISNSIVKFSSRFFNPELITSIYLFLIFNLKNPQHSDFKKQKLNTLLDTFFPLFKKVIVLTNNYNETAFLDLYQIILSNFIDLNFHYSKDFFKYYYLYRIVKDKNTNISNDLAQVMIQYLNTDLKAEYLKSVIESSVSIEEFLEDSNHLSVIIKRASSEQDYLYIFFNYFSNEQKKSILLEWINLDPKTLENLLQNITYAISEPVEFAIAILQITSNISGFEKNRELYNILFKLKLPLDFDFINYSNQIITLIISSNTSYQEYGLEQLNKNRKNISELELKIKSEEVLAQTFLNNIHAYTENIKNIFNSKFNGYKKFINDILKSNIEIRNSFVLYLISSGNNDFLIFLKTLLTKSNYISISQEFLKQLSFLLINDKNSIEKFRSIIKNLTAKNLPEVKPEVQILIDNYKTNLRSEVDELIADIEKLIK